MLRRAAILKHICDRRRAQNAQKMKCNIMHHQNRQKTLKRKII